MNCMRQPMVQVQSRCRIATKTYENIFKETTWNTLLQFPSRNTSQNLGPALRETCAMQVLNCHKSSPQTHKLNLDSKALERYPYAYWIIVICKPMQISHLYITTWIIRSSRCPSWASCSEVVDRREHRCLVLDQPLWWMGSKKWDLGGNWLVNDGQKIWV